MGLNPLIKDTDKDGIPDNEEEVVQALAKRKVISSLFNNNLAIPSLQLTAKGNINRSVTIRKAELPGLDDSRAVVGKGIEIVGLISKKGTLSFKLDKDVNPILSIDEKEINKLRICYYTKETGTAYLDTRYDTQNHTLTADIKQDGIYFLMDIEVLFNDLGVSLTEILNDSESNHIPNPLGLHNGASLDKRMIMGLASYNSILASQPKNVLALRPMDVLEGSGGSNKLRTMGQADIVFVIDTTLSMNRAIDNVVENIGKFVDELKANDVAINLALIEYQDIEDMGRDSTKVHKNGYSNWFSSTDAFKEEINLLETDMGSDLPESVIDALETARNLDFRSASEKFIILVTDAPYKVANRFGIKSMQEEIDLLRKDNIRTFIIGPQDEKDIYSNLYSNTGGDYMDIFGDFAKELPRIAEKITQTVLSNYWIILDSALPKVIKLNEAPKKGSKVDTDEDGVYDIDELGTTIPKSKEWISSVLEKEGLANLESVQVYNYKTDPSDVDTDSDGYTDDEDLYPLQVYRRPIILLPGFKGNTRNRFGVNTKIRGKGHKDIKFMGISASSLNSHYITENCVISEGFVDQVMNQEERTKTLTNGFRKIKPLKYYDMQSHFIDKIIEDGTYTKGIGSTLTSKYGYNKNENLFALNYPNKDFVWKNADLLEWFIEEIKKKRHLYATDKSYWNEELKFTIITSDGGEFIVRYYNENMEKGDNLGRVIVYNEVGIINDIFSNEAEKIRFTTPFKIDMAPESDMRRGQDGQEKRYKALIIGGKKIDYLNSNHTRRLQSEKRSLAWFDKHSKKTTNYDDYLLAPCYIESSRKSNEKEYVLLDNTILDKALNEGMFELPSNQYSSRVAELSIEASTLAYDDMGMASRVDNMVNAVPDRLLKMLRELKFEYKLDKYDYENDDIHNYLDKKPHNNSYTLAHRTITIDDKNYNLLGIIIRGTDSNEWQGNFEMWKDGKTPSDTHYSFNESARRVMGEVNEYINEHPQLKNKDDLKIWITGHSRGAAVANLVAAELSRDARLAFKSNIYAYTFATPNVTKSKIAGDYSNIYNFVNNDDFVTLVPLVEWGYTKYGHVLSYNTKQLGNSKTFMNTYHRLGQISLNVDPQQTLNAVSAFKKIASNVDEYYNIYDMALEYKTFRDFAYEVIAKAAMNDRGAASTIFRYSTLHFLSKYHKVSKFFMNNADSTILFAHQAPTYFALVKHHNELTVK